MPTGVQYSDLDMERAIASYVVHGTFAAAERETGVSADAIRKRRERNPEWFEGVVLALRQDFDEEHRAVIRKAFLASSTQALDRAENGELVSDDKGGYTKRKPMAGRDAAWIAAVMFDKLRISLGQPTSIAARAGDSTIDKLDALRKAATTAAKEQGIESGKVVEMGRAESIDVPDKSKSTGAAA